jgi:hypothetical protein
MAKQLPKIFYGLHFYPGVAEYREPGTSPKRVYLNENTLRSMDSTFAGRPVYVRHVEDVDLQNIQTEADGYVVKSFYNEADGKHWAQFIVVSDKGHEAIAKGWKLSNAYQPKSTGPGGQWNGVDYVQEITSGEYNHLAIVNDPRYNESKILTPEEFKLYNTSKLTELKLVANSKTPERKSMFDFFKKTKVENEKIEELTVTLPKSGKSITIAELIASADVVTNEAEDDKPKQDKEDKSEKKSEEKGEVKEKESEGKAEKKPEGEGKEEAMKAAPEMASLDHHVMVGNASMPLRDYMAKCSKMEDCMNALAEHHAGMMKERMSGESGNPLIKKNESDEVKVKEKTEIKPEVDYFSKLKNAKEEAEDFQSGIVTVAHLDGLIKGKARYGRK